MAQRSGGDPNNGNEESLMTGRENGYCRLSVSDSLSLLSTPHALLRQLGVMEDDDHLAGAMTM
jgi:hypothetical protein